MKKQFVFFIAGLVCGLLTLIFGGLVSTTAPTLLHEGSKFLWFTLSYYATINPTFMFLSILFFVSAVLSATFMLLSVIFAYIERKETKKDQ